MQHYSRLRSIRHCLVVAAALLTLCFGWGRLSCAFDGAHSTPAERPAAGIGGTVFEDLDGNGLHGEGEPGIEGVAVSDQIHVVATGPDGAYRLGSRGRFGQVMVRVPSGYDIDGPFWKRADAEATARNVDFPLVRRDPDGDFTFLHASDTHTSEETLDRSRRLRELVVTLKPDLVLITGDIVANAPGVNEERAKGDFELFEETIGSLKVPVFTVPGNRDTFGVERHNSLVSPQHPLFGKEMYRRSLGTCTGPSSRLKSWV